MTSRKPTDEATYVAELQFVQTAWENEPATFSNDRACFENYVRMQARFARADGFPVIAQQIENVLTSTGISFRTLTPTEESKFRAWARDNYKPLTDISQVWHPVVQDECRKMNDETGWTKID